MNSGEENSPAAPAGFRTRNLSIWDRWVQLKCTSTVKETCIVSSKPMDTAIDKMTAIQVLLFFVTTVNNSKKNTNQIKKILQKMYEKLDNVSLEQSSVAVEIQCIHQIHS